VCANKAASVFRRRATEARALLRLTARLEPTTDGHDPDADLWTEVRRLPRRQAQAIALYYVYGRSVAEVARILECSEGSVKTHLHRGRTTLAARLGTDVGDDA
jgi:RNA polymerase sigma-70 factor (ECF subfamily)